MKLSRGEIHTRNVDSEHKLESTLIICFISLNALFIFDAQSMPYDDD